MGQTSGHVSIQTQDSAAVDSFGRFRVSQPTVLWDSQFEYDLHDIFYDTITANNGTVTHNAPHSAANINVATDSASRALIQSYEYFRYQPGKSQQVLITYIFAAATTNLDQRVGQFDDNNGFFIEMTDSTVNFVRRTKTSGSVVNNKTAQADWNIDPMDGTGPSHITLDHTKGQILEIDYQWLSLGRIRYGFSIGGVNYYCHEELIANINAAPSTTTPNLPIRWEAVTTDTIAGARTLEAICASISAEGGTDIITQQPGHIFSFTREGATAANNVEEALIGIRCAATLNSVEYRGLIVPLHFTIAASAQDCLWRLRYVPTTLTSVSWQAGQTNSGVQTDIATTVISGGTVIDSGFIAAGQGQFSGTSSGDILYRLPLTLDADGTQTISLFLTIEGIGGTTTASGAITWKEIR